MIRGPAASLCAAVVAVMWGICPAPQALGADAPASDLKAALQALQQAVANADTTEALDSVDQIASWEQVIAGAESVLGSVQQAIVGTDAAIAGCRSKLALVEGDAAKTGAFERRIEALQSQADNLTLLQKRTQPLVSKLKARIAAIRADPDINQLLEAEATMRRAEAASAKADQAIPAFLKED